MYDLLRGRTSAFLIFRSFEHSYGRSRQKGRTCRRHAMTDFMSNVNTKSVSATPAVHMTVNHWYHRLEAALGGRMADDLV